MAITPTERNALVGCLLNAIGEDYPAMGRLVYYLRLEFPALDWENTLTSIATTHQPFIDSGLSIDWWVTEVIRQANVYIPG